MNVQDNTLYDLNKFDELAKVDQLKFNNAKLSGNIVEVPKDLQSEATQKLNGQAMVKVPKIFGGKLSQFAKKERKKHRKAQKQSRKNNRKNK
jgi:hypothetical protein